MTTAADGAVANRGMITGSIMLATIMQVVDTTIVNVALPHMQGSMSATQDQISWVLTSYIVMAAIFTPLTGVLGDKLGRKQLFLICVIGFIVASMLCGAATTLEEIVLFRALQGAAGAGLVPLSQAVLLDAYPREKHGSAMALWGMGVMVGPILGPTLGGYLTEYYSWRWAFYINLPVGILAVLGITAFVPDTARTKRGGFDMFGFAMLSLLIGSLQLMLDRGNSQDWFGSPEIVLEATIAGLAMYLFLVHMFTSDKPFIEPGLFADRNFTVGILLMFLVGIMLFSGMALLPPFLQGLLGFPVITAGYVMAPRGLGTMIAMMIVGRLIGRVDARLLILFGLGLMTWSLWEMTQFTAEVGVREIIYTGVIQGVGLGFIFVPLSTVAFATLAPRYRGEGTAMFSLVRNIGSSIGISLVMTVLGRQVQSTHAALAENITPFRTALHAPGVPTFWSSLHGTGLLALNGEVSRQALTLAYVNDFRFMLLMTFMAVPLLLLLRKPAPARQR
ncbi:MAG TPA: DHA2 family efflux MFS transporter permease subunit [Gammaproteobacteria bacterium]|jgi:DHA2 family multidrug resistance protein|nr:DHA2 family efflux MFS transporter permease subunit [Gammaproteobacteria bacterium]